MKKILLFLPVFFPANAWAQTPEEMVPSDFSSQPLLLLVVFAGLAIAPFVGMLITSFVKIAVVLSISRQAIGLQQVPPSPVITGLAILLSIYVMQPVGMQVYESAKKYFQQKNETFLDKANIDLLAEAAHAAEIPIKNFLQAHASQKNIQMFYNLSRKMHKPHKHTSISASDYLVLIPAFIISELATAFQIGFIIFLPFLIVDMVVANILMALGMQMLSPTTISLPFKILLFVMVDGWHLITKGLVLGYFN